MNFCSVYFIGIGGIGMSALARYFKREGRFVAGYDRTPTRLTQELEEEEIRVHFEDSVSLIGDEFRDPARTLVVYTPAVPDDHNELSWFRNGGFEVLKRSEILGHISEGKCVMAVAGSHGKTTTTTLVAWLNHCSGGGGSAFLGGISKNFDSNLILGEGNRLAVEADEFDRSFLRLSPDIALITAVDPDHLDIYGSYDAVKEAFSQFVERIKPGGTLIVKKEVDIELRNNNIKVYRYSCNDTADFYAAGISPSEGGRYRFDMVCPDRTVRDCTLGVPGRINIENAVAAVSMLWAAGFDGQSLRRALAEYRGVKRRFDMYINTPGLVYMDDYAHHPRELKAALESVREMFPARRITAIFQPHLYTRTRDFYREFGESLSYADRVVLTPIYPAREEPIEGIDSELIGKYITTDWCVVPKEGIAGWLAGEECDVVVTFGAGDIDKYCGDIADTLKKRIGA